MFSYPVRIFEMSDTFPVPNSGETSSSYISFIYVFCKSMIYKKVVSIILEYFAFLSNILILLNRESTFILFSFFHAKSFHIQTDPPPPYTHLFGTVKMLGFDHFQTFWKKVWNEKIHWKQFFFPVKVRVKQTGHFLTEKKRALWNAAHWPNHTLYFHSGSYFCFLISSKISFLINMRACETAIR